MFLVCWSCQLDCVSSVMPLYSVSLWLGGNYHWSLILISLAVIMRTLLSEAHGFIGGGSLRESQSPLPLPKNIPNLNHIFLRPLMDTCQRYLFLSPVRYVGNMGPPCFPFLLCCYQPLWTPCRHSIPWPEGLDIADQLPWTAMPMPPGDISLESCIRGVQASGHSLCFESSHLLFYQIWWSHGSHSTPPWYHYPLSYLPWCGVEVFQMFQWPKDAFQLWSVWQNRIYVCHQIACRHAIFCAGRHDPCRCRCLLDKVTKPSLATFPTSI